MTSKPPRHEHNRRRLAQDGWDDASLGAPPDLSAWADPEIDLTHRAQVFAALRHPVQPSPGRVQVAWTLLRAQARVVRRDVWLASAFSIVLGALATLFLYSSTGTVALALVAPVAAAAGIAFIYGPDADPPLEILLTTPVTPRQVLLARIVLVFAFDLVLGMGATLLLSGFLPVALWTLLTMWLAPMAFLSALAYLGSVLFMNSLVGVMISLCAWFAFCIGYLARSQATPLPDFTAAGSQLPLWIGTVALALAAYWLTGIEEHWMRQR